MLVALISIALKVGLKNNVLQYILGKQIFPHLVGEFFSKSDKFSVKLGCCNGKALAILETFFHLGSSFRLLLVRVSKGSSASSSLSRCSISSSQASSQISFILLAETSSVSLS